MRIIDKIEKIGKDAVIEELQKINVEQEKIDKIMNFIAIDGSNDDKLKSLSELGIESEKFVKGLEELTEVVKYMRLFGIPESNFKIDLTIARGLDYYTGTVYETFLNKYKNLGSICSGGRYENLAEYYTDKKLPGVGISIGLTRLFYQLSEIGLIKSDKKAISDVLVISMTDNFEYVSKVANKLRDEGKNVQVYYEDKKVKAKFKYADKLEIPYTVVIGDDEVESGSYSLKNMMTGEQESQKL